MKLNKKIIEYYEDFMANHFQKNMIRYFAKYISSVNIVTK